jgi:hypothetical protein
MTVLNFKFNKISAERKDRNVKAIEVKANSTILSMKKDKDKRIGDYLHVNFKYVVEYAPDIGKVELDGHLWFQHPKLDSVVSDLKDKMELSNEAIKEISNSVIQESIVEALEMSRKLQLPPPLQLPTVTVKPEKMKFAKAP